eukprot:CAMPEP_0195521338 /NCGR_PEP_ID=MMETSP0794_2-20130614/18486_1 /TAXON_ID=515487 /ORGANISM="Stephanopyxis turris, Strain CCMP 815" /LENGTH=114 /DNA_ID=CAMNT_0040650867 /DNA_START=406 /DNA_END=750 /DNA_ORIENTATION=+
MTSLIVVSLKRPLAIFLVGLEGVGFCVCLFASPLAALKAVIATRSSKSIPLPFTLASFFNCFLWSVVGYVELHDFMVFVPNALGFVFSLAQLMVKAKFGDGAGRPVTGVSMLPV